MQIICISGKAQHGKDTTAEYLRQAFERHGKRVLITHYGDLVKYVCRTFCGWDGVKDEAGRTMLQQVGTDIVRAKYPNYWVDFVKEILDLLAAREQWDYVLIPDCRFPNEVIGLHLRVTRPNFDNGLTPEQQNHPSETALDGYPVDLWIGNCGSLDGLRDTCELLVEDAVHYFCDAGRNTEVRDDGV